MSINVSQISNDFNKTTLENYDKAAVNVASNLSSAEDVMVRTYTAKGQGAIDSLAKELGLEKRYDDKGNEIKYSAEDIQLVAKTKYEKASRIYSMFAKVMENAHQMLMQVINKIG